jgi:hypothetical protein
MGIPRKPFILLLALLLTLVAGRRADGQALPGPCTKDALPGGTQSLICVPNSGWNGQLVVFAHGYVAFNKPIDFYHLELADGTSLPTLVQNLGLALATTMQAAVSSVNWGLNAKPSLVKKAVDRWRSLTGRLTKILVAIMAPCRRSVGEWWVYICQGTRERTRSSRKYRPPQSRAPRMIGKTTGNAPLPTRTCVATAPPR